MLLVIAMDYFFAAANDHVVVDNDGWHLAMLREMLLAALLFE